MLWLQEDTGGEMLVCTVGELRVWPGAGNVIPGSVQLSVDIRAKVGRVACCVCMCVCV